MPNHWPTPTELATALLVSVAIAIHVVAYGYWTLRILGYAAQTRLAYWVVLVALGFVVFECEIWALGHLTLLTQTAFTTSTVLACIALAIAIVARGPVRQWCCEGRLAKLRQACGREPVLALAMLILTGFVALSGLRGAVFEDDYKWESPRIWASAGRWVRSPFRISNGMELTEVLYTFPAVFGSLMAAHWAHAMMWVLLLLGVAALGQVLGASPVAAIAAIAAVPVVSSAAATANTDVPCASLLIAAYVCVLCGRRPDDDGPLTGSTLSAAGLILAGAISSKSFAIAGAVPLGLYVCAEAYRTSFRPGMQVLADVLRQGAWITVPAVLIVLLWMAHTYSLIGRPWDTSGQYMARDPADIMWTTGQAAGRIPRPVDLLTLPIVPFYAALLGSAEPYGGRIGILTVSFSLVGIYFIGRLPIAKKRRARWLMASGLIYYLLLGPFAIKTRFHIFVWSVCAVFGAFAYAQFCPRPDERPGLMARAARVAFLLLALVGIADSVVRKLLLRG